jgi:hypothetical protein
MALCIGLMAAFAGNSFIFEIHNEYTKTVFFSTKTFSPEVLAFKNWLFGIIGGTIVGFHILMIMISENAFKNKEKWAYYALWLGLISWFIIDSCISAYYNAFHNILIINIVALFLIALPLIMTRKYFR